MNRAKTSGHLQQAMQHTSSTKWHKKEYTRTHAHRS